MVKPLKTIIFINASVRCIFNSINLKFGVKSYLTIKEKNNIFACHLVVNGGNSSDINKMPKNTFIVIGKKMLYTYINNSNIPKIKLIG